VQKVATWRHKKLKWKRITQFGSEGEVQRLVSSASNYGSGMRNEKKPEEQTKKRKEECSGLAKKQQRKAVRDLPGEASHSKPILSRIRGRGQAGEKGGGG